MPTLVPQRVLVPPPAGYEVEWQVHMDVACWKDSNVWIAYSAQDQLAIEKAWMRGKANAFVRPQGDEMWKLDLNSLLVSPIDCPWAPGKTHPIRRVFVPSFVDREGAG